MLTRLRATGMPIRQIRTYAELVPRGDGNEQQRLELLLAHRERVLAELEEVRGHLAALDAKIAIDQERVAVPAPQGRRSA